MNEVAYKYIYIVCVCMCVCVWNHSRAESKNNTPGNTKFIPSGQLQVLWAQNILLNFISHWRKVNESTRIVIRSYRKNICVTLTNATSISCWQHCDMYILDCHRNNVRKLVKPRQESVSTAFANCTNTHTPVYKFYLFFKDAILFSVHKCQHFHT